MTRASFETALKKGEVGERIVKGILERRGFVVYRPTTDCAHAFDVLAIKDKERCVAVDVKAKARRNKYADTGVNIEHYECYKRFSELHSMPFWIVFVDEMIGSIYGNELKELDKPRSVDGLNYPLRFYSKNGVIIYWPLVAMHTFYTMSTQETEELKANSQRRHEYSINPTSN